MLGWSKHFKISISLRSFCFSSSARRFLFIILTALKAFVSLCKHFLTSPYAPEINKIRLNKMILNEKLTSSNTRWYLVKILYVSEIFFYECGTCTGCFARWVVTTLRLFTFTWFYILLLLSHLLEPLYSWWIIIVVLLHWLLVFMSLLKLLLLIVLQLLLLLYEKFLLLCHLFHRVSTHPMLHTVLVRWTFRFLIELLWMLALVYKLWVLIWVLILVIMVWNSLSIVMSLPFLHFW